METILNCTDLNQLEENLQKYSLLDQTAHLGDERNLPDGISCNGIVITFASQAEPAVASSIQTTSSPLAAAKPRISVAEIQKSNQEIKISPGKLAYIQKFSPLFKSINDACPVVLDSISSIITVNASDADIEKLVEECFALQELANPFPSEITSFINNNDNCDAAIENELQKKSLTAVLHKDDEGQPVLCAATRANLKEAQTIISAMFDKRSVSVEEHCFEYLSSAEGERNCEELEKKYGIIITTDPTEKRVIVIGFNNNLDKSISDINAMLRTKCLLQISVVFKTVEDLNIVWDAYSFELG